MSSWYRQRLQAGLNADPRLRGSRSIFREVSDLDFSTMSEPERCGALLNIARHLASIEGLPETSIRLADEDSIGTAAASFLDAPTSFNQPLVVLDRRFFRSDVEPDVFVGLVLHEIAHLLFTRDFYRIGANLSKQMKLLVNLIEDYRIEQLMSESSIAWRTYLERTRRRLVVDDSLTEGVAKWKFLGNYDRVVLVIGLFLFTPEVLESRRELREWKLPDGVCVFAELEEILYVEPLSESQVLTAAEAIYDRIDVFKAVDMVQLPSRLEAARDFLRRFHGEAAEKAEGSGETRTSDPRRLLDWLLKRNSVEESFPSVLIKQIEIEANRTGCPEPLPLAFDSKRDADTRNKANVEFKEIARSALAQERYDKVAFETRKTSEELEKIFADPTLGRGRSFLAQPSGRLAGRRLHRYSFDSRLFTEERQARKKLRPTRIVLLLDGSGSMVGVPEQVALQLGVLLCEAFRKSSNVEFRVFSHTALEDRVTIHDFGDKHTTQARLGAFQAERMSNYDDVAIEAVSKLFAEDADKRRVMFTLSDARPIAVEGSLRRSDLSAVHLTARAVKKLRSEGWRVIGITTDQGHGKLIYGNDRVHLEHLNLIPEKFANLLLDLFPTE